MTCQHGSEIKELIKENESLKNEILKLKDQIKSKALTDEFNFNERIKRAYEERDKLKNENQSL